MNVFEMAKQYYPRLWSEERIRALVEAGRLTHREAEEIMHPSEETQETEI